MMSPLALIPRLDSKERRKHGDTSHQQLLNFYCLHANFLCSGLVVHMQLVSTGGAGADVIPTLTVRMRLSFLLGWPSTSTAAIFSAAVTPSVLRVG